MKSTCASLCVLALSFHALHRIRVDRCSYFAWMSLKSEAIRMKWSLRTLSWENAILWDYMCRTNRSEPNKHEEYQTSHLEQRHVDNLFHCEACSRTAGRRKAWWAHRYKKQVPYTCPSPVGKLQLTISICRLGPSSRSAQGVIPSRRRGIRYWVDGNYRREDGACSCDSSPSLTMLTQQTGRPWGLA
jgi:hypothetical protein